MTDAPTFDVTLLRNVPEGACLAHHDGRTWFIRHGIAGERVRVAIDDVSGSIGRAHVVEVLEASPKRVTPPCRFAGECGGCDYQHIELAEQRHVKSLVLQDALRRQGGFPNPPLIPVIAVPGDTDGLRWRTQMSWQRTPEGRRGLFQHRSHNIVEIDDCLIARLDARDSTPGVFSQSHVGLPDLLRQRIEALGVPNHGEHWWDLYGGSGELSHVLVSSVGSDGRVDVVDSSQQSVARVRSEMPGVLHAHHAKVEDWIMRQSRVDGVVVDPPRSGIPKAVIAGITRCKPRVVVSISCHPVTFSRDLATFEHHDYVATHIEAYDAYPMTWHMELVAALVPRHAADQIALLRDERTVDRE